MPLIPIDHVQVHLAEALEDARPRSTQPTPPVQGLSAATPASLPRAVADTTRRHWPVAALHVIVLVAALLWGADSLAQPLDAGAGAGAGLPMDVGTLSGSPWATAVAVALLALGQLGSGLREWARVRGADLDAKAARVAALEAQLLDTRADLSRAEAQRDLALAREGDARAAVSGTPSRPPDLAAS